LPLQQTGIPSPHSPAVWMSGRKHHINKDIRD
jgi:hypothetical protein